MSVLNQLLNNEIFLKSSECRYEERDYINSDEDVLHYNEAGKYRKDSIGFFDNINSHICITSWRNDKLEDTYHRVLWLVNTTSNSIYDYPETFKRIYIELNPNKQIRIAKEKAQLRDEIKNEGFSTIGDYYKYLHDNNIPDTDSWNKVVLEDKAEIICDQKISFEELYGIVSEFEPRFGFMLKGAILNDYSDVINSSIKR